MSKYSKVKTILPLAVTTHLTTLGEHIRLARKRRKMSLANCAQRLQVSIPTLRRIEAGDPSVSMAGYATALWIIGREQYLSEIAKPETDEVALMIELDTMRKRT